MTIPRPICKLCKVISRLYLVYVSYMQAIPRLCRIIPTLCTIMITLCRLYKGLYLNYVGLYLGYISDIRSYLGVGGIGRYNGTKHVSSLMISLNWDMK
jgi:hypothetical protein